jgi:hypothetical protein
MMAEIERFEAPLQGTVAEVCGATESSCACGLRPHAEGAHVCKCGGSGEWRDGEFVIHALPQGPLAGVLDMLFAGAAPFRKPAQQASCYQLPSGSMVHVKPGCRCG